MRNFLFQTTIISIVTVAIFAPLYAHHGTEFLLKAMEINTAGVRFADMAPSRTQNPRIKEFAQMLVRDQNQALDEISELRDIRLAASLSDKNQIDSKTAKAAAAIQLTPEHQRALEKLSNLSGADFDREFIDLIVRDHLQAIHDFESQSHVHGNAGGVTQQKETESLQNRQK